MEIFPRNGGLELRGAYEGGLIFRSEDLAIDVETQVARISEASARAFSFAVEIGYPTPATIGPMLQKAQTKARALVLDAGMIVPSMMEFILARAAADASAIASIASGQKAPAAPEATAAPAAKGKEEKKEEEGDTTAAGLGALFG